MTIAIQTYGASGFRGAFLVSGATSANFSYSSRAINSAIRANASMLHLTGKNIITFFEQKTKYLAEGGIIHMSMKTGIPQGDDAKGRHFTPFTEDLLEQILKASGLKLIDR